MTDQGLGTTAAGSDELETLFNKELRQGEKLLWTGRPSPRGLLSPGDLGAFTCITLLFTVMISGIASLAEIAELIWGNGLSQRVSMALPVITFAAVFAVIGVIVGLSIMYSRKRASRRLRYAITDQRVIFADISDGLSIVSVPIDQIPGVSKVVDSEGFGRIRLTGFETRAMGTIIYCDNSGRSMNVCFLRDIPHADKVCSLLSGLIDARVRPDQGDTSFIAPPVASGIDLPSAALPPRTVGPALAAMALLTPAAQFGVFWLGLVMVFVRILCPGLDLVPIASVFSGVGSAAGVVTSQRATGSYDEGGNVATMLYTYTFRDQGGRTIRSSYHSAGGPYEKDAKITVEYARACPRISRIVGLDAATSWGTAGCIGLFVAVGIAILASGLVTGARELRLLRSGRAVVAEYRSAALRRSRSSDGESAEDRYYCDICYEFASPNGPQKVRTRQPVECRHRSERSVDLDLPVHAPQSIIALYDPARPGTAVALSDLPGDPRLDKQGRAYSGKPRKALGYLFIPSLVLAVHGIWWYLASHG